jgi:HAD superfamily hydrolase (TIGR01509 family)
VAVHSKRFALCCSHHKLRILQVLGDECKRAKPHPEPYLRGLEICKVEACDALAFEDSRPGATAAIAAKIPTVGVCTTLSPEKLREIGAFLTIKDFTDR